MENIKLVDWSSKALALFGEVRDLLSRSANPDLRALKSKVPTSIEDDGRKINVVFAGEYGAGKSTIISLLTGKKLEIGGGVTTQKCSTFDWNGISVTDTPGVHNQGRTDHDQITYDAIAKADLVIFVTTAKGFSERVGRHFRELIIDRHKGQEMMLIVNKMESMRDGNTPEMRKAVGKSIAEVLAPEYRPEDFYTCYIDAECYSDSLREKDPAGRRELEEISCWSQLIGNINKFVADKKVLGRQTASLFELEQVLVDANGVFKSGDLCVDGSVQILNTQRRMIREFGENIRQRSRRIICDKAQLVRDNGEAVATALSSSSNPEAFTRMVEAKYDEVNEISQEAFSELEKEISAESSKLEQEMSNYAISPFVGQVKSAIEVEYGHIDWGGGKAGNAEQIAKKVGDFGGWLAKISGCGNATFSQMMHASTFSGSTMHKAVYSVGKFLGHKFVPWEAVGIAGKIGWAGKLLGVAGLVASVAFSLYGWWQEHKEEKQREQVRSDIRYSFNEAARLLESNYKEQLDKWLADNVVSEISEIDGQVNDLRNMSQVHDAEGDKLKALLVKTRDMISRVQLG